MEKQPKKRIVCVRLRIPLVAELDELAARRHSTRTGLVEDAIQALLNLQGHRRLQGPRRHREGA